MNSSDPEAAGHGPKPEPDPGPPAPIETTRLGAGTFTIEGRRAPALFVIGWLVSLVGLGAIGVAVLAGGSSAAPFILIAGLVALTVGLIAGAGSQAVERRARGGTGYTGASPILVFAGSIPTALLAVIVVGIPVALLGIPVDGPVGRLAAVAVQALVYVGLIRLLVVDMGALSWNAMGIHRPGAGTMGELAAGALWAAPVILLTIPLVAILGALLPVTPVSPLPPAGEAGGFAINLLAGAIIAPIGEEIMFRGFATTAWARDLGARRALIRGALFFAVVHVLTISGASAGEAVALSIVGFVSRIPVALALGWLFLRRGSIWAPIGLHAAFNGILIVLGELAVRSNL